MHRLFPSQQDDETIYLVVREHWIFLLLRLLIIVFLFMGLLAFQAYGPQMFPALFSEQLRGMVSLLSQLYVIILVAATFLVWVLYYLNIQVITNLRVVDIDQRGLFNRRTSELHIDKIEDATSESNGIFSNIFGYGNVYVQTAGTRERFEFDRIPSPDKVERLILDLYEKRPKEVQTAG